jgi:hypothetical protein
VLHTFRGAGVFRLVYLDRFNGRKHESVEATESRKARPAISFRDQRGWNSVGLDRSVRDERDHISDPAGSARMAIHH